jgi:hypothetical protein
MSKQSEKDGSSEMGEITNEMSEAQLMDEASKILSMSKSDHPCDDKKNGVEPTNEMRSEKTAKEDKQVMEPTYHIVLTFPDKHGKLANGFREKKVKGLHEGTILYKLCTKIQEALMARYEGKCSPPYPLHVELIRHMEHASLHEILIRAQKINEKEIDVKTMSNWQMEGNRLFLQCPPLGSNHEVRIPILTFRKKSGIDGRNLADIRKIITECLLLIAHEMNPPSPKIPVQEPQDVHPQDPETKPLITTPVSDRPQESSSSESNPPEPINRSNQSAPSRMTCLI